MLHEKSKALENINFDNINRSLINMYVLSKKENLLKQKNDNVKTTFYKSSRSFSSGRT